MANVTIWQSLDFKTVQQRLNRITAQLEMVLSKPPQVEATNLISPEDYANLKEFMEANQLTESQAIAKIVHAFFSDTPQASTNSPSAADEMLERIATLEQQVAALVGKVRS